MPQQIPDAYIAPRVSALAAYLGIPETDVKPRVCKDGSGDNYYETLVDCSIAYNVVFDAGDDGQDGCWNVLDADEVRDAKVTVIWDYAIDAFYPRVVAPVLGVPVSTFDGMQPYSTTLLAAYNQVAEEQGMDVGDIVQGLSDALDNEWLVEELGIPVHGEVDGFLCIRDPR